MGMEGQGGEAARQGERIADYMIGCLLNGTGMSHAATKIERELGEMERRGEGDAGNRRYAVTVPPDRPTKITAPPKQLCLYNYEVEDIQSKLLLCGPLTSNSIPRGIHTLTSFSGML